MVRHAYLRWLHTQGVPWREAAGSSWSPSRPEPDGRLVKERWLHSRRAPGNTCLSALRATGETDAQSGFAARNHSKGCGGVMRMAPVGLLSSAGSGDEINPTDGIFRLGIECVALTHGHPTGQLAAGALAATISTMVHDGHELCTALTRALLRLRWRKQVEETYAAINDAIVTCRHSTTSGRGRSSSSGTRTASSGAEGLERAQKCDLEVGEHTRWREDEPTSPHHCPL